MIVEGDRFLPKIYPINPASLLKDRLKSTLLVAIAVSIKKARSEGVINLPWLEIELQVNGQIRGLSGKEFNITLDVELLRGKAFILYVNFLPSARKFFGSSSIASRLPLINVARQL